MKGELMKKVNTSIFKKNYADKIGLDFGTTYSVISRIKEKQGGNISVEACALREGGARAEIQDSIVLKNKEGQLFLGPSARRKVGKIGTVTYTGFKMMLAETDQTLLAQRNYDEIFTPKKIIKEYIDDLLTQYLSTLNGNPTRIEKLVVGVPEIWFTSALTIDCRTALKDIIQGLDYVDNVELVSEPAAACAYFVQNYYESTGKKYEGKILIVDYGGGTLDIALCDVKGNGISSEVKAIARAGEGWNTQGTIGKAGMAFMEEIVKIALRKEGFKDSDIISDQKFFSMVQYIEQELMSRVGEIKNSLGKYRLKFETPEEINEIFDTFEYKDNEIEVSYGMLVQAYNTIIRDSLDNKLNEIIEYMNTKGIEYRGGGEKDDFKIALVGGFCNFYLTEYQIKEKFESVFGVEDKRYKYIIADRRDCEKAISYGAALIANEIIAFKQVAPYSLGFASKLNPDKPFFAIKKGDDIEFGKVKMFSSDDGQPMLFRGNGIPLIAFNFEDDPKYMEAKEPLKVYQEKLNLEKDKIYQFGYSLDQSMVITLHKLVVPDRNNPDCVKDESKVTLDDIYNMMGNLMLIGGRKS